MEASLPANEELLLNSMWMRRASPAEVKSLLVDGADLTARDKKGQTPLHTAARNTNPDIIACLLDRGADLNARDETGYTPLQIAVKYNNIAEDNNDIVALFLNHGADPNVRDKEGRTPLHVAAWLKTNPAVVALLLNHGADTSLRDNEGNLPVDLAQYNKALKGTDAFQRLHQPPHESALRDLDNLTEDEQQETPGFWRRAYAWLSRRLGA
ncbi:MAG: ankyrin repeat domain-containing protein [Desulfurellaceae bacterium]|nr:ankyrin repeat domain-containing protein [Desulfurellaceae bacterium]